MVSRTFPAPMTGTGFPMLGKNQRYCRIPRSLWTPLSTQLVLLLDPSQGKTQGRHSLDHLSSVNRRSGAELESAGLHGQLSQVSSWGRGVLHPRQQAKPAGMGLPHGPPGRARRQRFQEPLTCKTHERPACLRVLFAPLSDQSLTMWR